MVSVGDVRVSGIEVVEEIDGGEGEQLFLLQLPEPITVVVGESAGLEMAVQDLEYVMAVEADFETTDMEKQIMGADHVEETVIAVSNEEGDTGVAIMVEERADMESVIQRFEEEEL